MPGGVRRSRGRFTTIAVIATWAVTALIGVMMVAGPWVRVSYLSAADRSGRQLMLGQLHAGVIVGVFSYPLRDPSAASTGKWTFERYAPRDSRWFERVSLVPSIDRGGWGSGIFVPLWIPAVMLGAASYMMTRRWRRLSATTSCRACGYSLVGLADGRCPECGRAFEGR